MLPLFLPQSANSFVFEKVIQPAAKSSCKSNKRSAGCLVYIFSAQFILLESAKIYSGLLGKYVPEKV